MKRSAPQTVLDLVKRFSLHGESYTSSEYNETQVRREFIDPMFKALGWDIDNEKGYAEPWKEVVHEDAIKVGGVSKAPDYAFRLGGRRLFFLEAKKPAVNLKDDPAPAFQLRRYAWTAKLPLSILTDFEEFIVYDTRIRPAINDKPATARIFYIRYNEYPERWDDIASIFSPEAIRKGAFDKYVESATQKRGTAEVDDAFLADIEEWREQLARNVALRNASLTQRELNFAVQRIIDRVIFLRICEDRGAEPYGRLQALLNGTNVYPRLREIFDRADERYNSGLFHFQKEKGRPSEPDELTPRLAIDDKVLKDIFRRLYYPESPYEFSVLPAEILGQVYERFLGSVIRLTPGGHAKVEEKPEVRKAGGVYYTPTYIVDYIVKHTVGKLLEGKTPQDVAGVTDAWRPAKNRRPIAILDPACGSGSFLLGAYQFLLDWHLEQYTLKPEKWSKGREPRIYQHHRGGWRLTTAERKRILLSNIFGVDIDPQAVEVTKLSLLLKVLEGENAESIQKQITLFHTRALPDLDTNIKCGNSLIGPDFYEGRQGQLFDEEEMYRVNAFDWNAEFREIMGSGGFDAIIGNPPWLLAGYYVTQGLSYLRQHYSTAQGKFDLYYVFLERSIRLLRESGDFGMIVPNKFFHTRAATGLRSLLAQGRYLQCLVDFCDEQIFAYATNYSCIVFLGKKPTSTLRFIRAKEGLYIVENLDVPASSLNAAPWHFECAEKKAVFQRMEAVGKPLEDFVGRFGTGVQSGADGILMMDAPTAKSQRMERDLLQPCYRGRDVRRYALSVDPKLLIFPYTVKHEKFVIIGESEIAKRKNVHSLLTENRQRLSVRVWFGKNAHELSGEWYGLMYLDSYRSFSMPHILTPSLSNRSNFALGSGNLFTTGTAGVTSIIPKPGIPESIYYLLGVLNSCLMSFYTTSHSPIFSGKYYKFSAPYLKKLPICPIDFSCLADKARHDRMVSLVERILDLHKRFAAVSTDHERMLFERQIAATDGEIDQLVYELYGLTDDEIAIVEEATKTA
jgi:type I restriction-modification system DNA methylase subunit/predicted type IV restriction endonuclease